MKWRRVEEIGEDATLLHHNHATSIALVSTHHLIISYSSRVVLSLISPCNLELGIIPIVTRWMSNKLVQLTSNSVQAIFQQYVVLKHKFLKLIHIVLECITIFAIDFSMVTFEDIIN